MTVKSPLNALKAAGGILTTTESVLFELMESAEHPQFKTISKLVKDLNAENVPEFNHVVMIISNN